MAAVIPSLMIPAGLGLPDPDCSLDPYPGDETEASARSTTPATISLMA
jgi:hypothetical protein